MLSPEAAQALAALAQASASFAEACAALRRMAEACRGYRLVIEPPRPPVVRDVFTPDMIERLLK
ncbi:MAG TPA: hypothetical protein PJ986_10570 [Gammaproteobacteria bacterium]|nr:hypothetical protein [Gammaproteobacteria bacterium]